ncbi:hypothetical protein ACO0LB_14615 [Undibacterium sp. SXout7W]|uniref:hypothetical protein n=1 Tax=Undibacterium sp. SXout7W TaxID=3413049 RepID=UPI003BF1B6EA
MNLNAITSRGGRSGIKREVIDVLEPRKQDKRLDKLILVRKQRIDRSERERIEARTKWRESRQELRKLKEQWREAVEAAQDFWQKARSDFFKMTTTSGEFRHAKAVYLRMKEQASQLHLECRTAVQPCKACRSKYFDACRDVSEASRQHEKMKILRDELLLLNAEQEQ